MLFLECVVDTSGCTGTTEGCNILSDACSKGCRAASQLIQLTCAERPNFDSAFAGLPSPAIAFTLECSVVGGILLAELTGPAVHLT